MLIDIGSGLRTQSGAPAIDEIVGEHCVHWADVDIVGRAGLSGVLEECLQCKDDILEAFNVLYVVDELVHAALAFGKLYLAVLVPELLIAHLGIGLGNLFLDTSEQFGGNWCKGIVAEPGGAGDDNALQETEDAQFCDHIVDRLYPLAVFQLLVLLCDLHVLDEVHHALLGNGELGAPDVVSGVVEYVEVATESHVLLVVGQEMQVDAAVAVDHHSVFNIIAVETDAFITQG